MTLYEVRIQRKSENPYDDIISFLDTYMGEPGMTKLLDDVENNTAEENSIIGDYTNFVLDDNIVKPNEFAYSLVWINSNGDVVKTLYRTAHNSVKWDYCFEENEVKSDLNKSIIDEYLTNEVGAYYSIANRWDTRNGEYFLINDGSFTKEKYALRVLDGVIYNFDGDAVYHSGSADGEKEYRAFKSVLNDMEAWLDTYLGNDNYSDDVPTFKIGFGDNIIEMYSGPESYEAWQSLIESMMSLLNEEYDLGHDSEFSSVE